MGLPRVWGRVGADIVIQRPPSGRPQEGEADDLKDLGQETIMGEVSNEAASSPTLITQPSRSHIAHRAKVFPAEYTGLGVGWTVAYYLLLVGGMLAFWKGFWVLTKSENELVEWGRR